jgi:Ulp1 family protease
VLSTRKSVAAAAAAAAAGAKIVATYFPEQWCKKYSFPVTLNDMLTMEKGQWMNDIALELGIHAIVDELVGDIYKDTCFVMSTFFSEKLRMVILTTEKFQ